MYQTPDNKASISHVPMVHTALTYGDEKDTCVIEAASRNGECNWLSNEDLLSKQ